MYTAWSLTGQACVGQNGPVQRYGNRQQKWELNSHGDKTLLQTV